jgi:hypothetical protein
MQVVVENWIYDRTLRSQTPMVDNYPHREATLRTNSVPVLSVEFSTKGG